MKWYIPSWNGDVRLVPFEKEASKTVMLIERPTAREQQQINTIGQECFKRGWLSAWEEFAPKQDVTQPIMSKFLINASLEHLGPVVVGILRPGPAVLTAIQLQNGQVITVGGGQVALEKAIETVYGPSAAKVDDQPKPAEPAPEPEKKPDAPTEPKAAATVKRHTPCCPECIPGSVGPAREVLLAFLNEDEHKNWSKTRTIVVTGGLSGCRYLLAHRHTDVAQENTRICYDMDSDCVVHFHDWTVPPEEEVLAAKLILEHREHWLRNEATMLGTLRKNTLIFKNPFGDGMDGVPDSAFTTSIGMFLKAALARS